VNNHADPVTSIFYKATTKAIINQPLMSRTAIFLGYLITKLVSDDISAALLGCSDQVNEVDMYWL